MASSSSSAAPASDVVALLRCPVCRDELDDAGSSHRRCTGCGRVWSAERGTWRMLVDVDTGVEEDARRRTSESFGYEWKRFGALRSEWRRNFLDYLRPHGPEFLAGKRVLDVGTGSGRHARQAWELGADVVAVDAGPAIDVARRNVPDAVMTIQADAEALPLAPASFDLVMSIGVLHHLPDPERAFREIVRYARPGGHVHIYLYWWPPYAFHRRVLRLVSVVRRLTTRMPHRVLHALCYPLAAALHAGVVAPYRALRRRPRSRRIAARFPLKTYADYPFGVLVNDQFDRFSAPIEHRYEREEVRRWLVDAGLEDVQVLPNSGWIASGRVPSPAA